MKIISNIAAWDRKFAWSFFGFLLAVFFGGLTLYNEFIRNPNPALAVQILSDTNVLDVKENIPELKIIYGDVDIKNLNQNLSVVVFRVENVGGAAILNTFYDEKAIPVLTLLTGKFVKVEQATATSAYLLNAAQPMLISQSAIALPRVILEPGESYTLKALLLHGPRSGLPFNATGKVAGVRDINIIGAAAATQKESFWLSVVSGSIPTQIARAPIYFLGFILLILGTLGPIAFTYDRIQAMSRSRTVKQFKNHYKGEINSPELNVLEVYKENGLRPLVGIRELLGDDEKLKKSLKLIEESESDPERTLLDFQGVDPVTMSESQARCREMIYEHEGMPIRTLKKLKIASVEEDGSCLVNKELELFLAKFIDYVNIKQS